MSSSAPTDIWTVKAALDWTADYLTGKGDPHGRLSAEWLLSAATGLSRVELYVYHDRPLSSEERSFLRASVRRRAAGEPLQYVTGEVAFRHIVVHTQQGVLIPRPETEVLVDVGLESIDRSLGERGSALALDLCTGSGVIALSLAREREGVSVVATDISDAAVALAVRNAEALGLQDRVSVVACDLDEGIDETLRGTFDLVISNPPYIPTAEVDLLDREIVGFEPRLALDGGEDGLDVFRRIADAARGLLRPGGMLACELHEDTLVAAAGLLAGDYTDIEVRSDLTGRDRIVCARRP